MVLAVIVTSYESPETLHRCLASLAGQSEAGEIVVSDCSRTNPAIALGPLFPTVRFLHSPVTQTVPQLRWKALPYVKADLVAAVEARCVPSSTWCRDLIKAHDAAPVWGGPVQVQPGASPFVWGLYFCEYGDFAPPLTLGPATALSGANLCYRRTALEEARDLTDAGSWETRIHRRWLWEGKQFVLCDATVTFFNSMSLWAAMRQRWHYGRGYAADRLSDASVAVRAAYACAACLLPVLLTWRMARRAYGTGRIRPFLRSLAWLALLNSCWSVGELVGYAVGPDPEPHIF